MFTLKPQVTRHMGGLGQTRNLLPIFHRVSARTNALPSEDSCFGLLFMETFRSITLFTTGIQMNVTDDVNKRSHLPQFCTTLATLEAGFMKHTSCHLEPLHSINSAGTQHALVTPTTLKRQYVLGCLVWMVLLIPKWSTIGL